MKSDATLEQSIETVEGILNAKKREPYILPDGIIPEMDRKKLSKKWNLLHLKRYSKMPSEEKIGIEQNLAAAMKTVTPDMLYVGYDFQGEENYTDRRYRIVHLSDCIKASLTDRNVIDATPYAYFNIGDISFPSRFDFIVPSFTDNGEYELTISDFAAYAKLASLSGKIRTVVDKRGYSIDTNCPCKKRQFYSTKNARGDIFDKSVEKRKGKEVFLCQHTIFAFQGIMLYGQMNRAHVVNPFYIPDSNDLLFYTQLEHARIQEHDIKRKLYSIEKEIMLWKNIGYKNIKY